jgi:glucose/arabinose dehydrogenase
MSGSGASGASGTELIDADIDATPSPGTFCALPGSMVATGAGMVAVPGGDTTHDISWLTVPVGFCAHYFATVHTVRQLRFAPDGDLFAASPTQGTTGGAGDGSASIVVLPDDNQDGEADMNIDYLTDLPATQGLMFNGGYFYYQNNQTILRVPFQAGDRKGPSSSETVTTIDSTVVPQATEHWPKVFDFAQDGTMYIANGGTDGEQCTSNQRLFGAFFSLNADSTVTEVSRGYRNPIAIRCESDHDVCLAAELAKDYSGGEGGREKLMPIRSGDDWGFPCCATQNLPYTGQMYTDTGATPDCSKTASENDAFIIGHTPFGLDFETGVWPAPWTHRVFVTLHGVFGTWEGARVVGISLDPTTGLPLPASELDASASSATVMMDFATGWDDGNRDHGRPAPIAFAPDGRLFIGDDQLGAVIWIAPMGLLQQ